MGGQGFAGPRQGLGRFGGGGQGFAKKGFGGFGGGQGGGFGGGQGFAKKAAIKKFVKAKLLGLI
jgi:hypothetical protein